jgi:hypothetical protein
VTAPVPRTLQITYAGVTVGGTTDYSIIGKTAWRRDYRGFSVTFKFAVPCYTAVDTAAAFQATCAALEAAFRTPKGTLVLSFDSLSHVSYADGTTAYEVESVIEKKGDEDGDTGRSRVYEVTVSGKLPADLEGRNFLARISWEVAYTPAGVRSLKVNGVYTRNGATDAYDQYLASVGNRITAIFTILGNTAAWELTGKSVRVLDDDGDEVEFTHDYEESIFNQALGTLNDPEIVRQALECSRSTTGPGDSPSGVKRVITLSLVYSAWLDKAVTTDLRGKWTSKIKPWLFQVLRDTAGSSVIGLEAATPRYDYKENRISVTLEATAVNGSKILSRRVTTQDRLVESDVIRKYWKQTGRAASYSPPRATVLRSPVTIERTVTIEEEVYGYEPLPGPGMVDAGAADPSPQGAAGSSGSLSGFGIGQSLSFSQGTSDYAGGSGSSQQVVEGSGASLPDAEALKAGVRWHLSDTLPRWTFLERGHDGMSYPVTVRSYQRVYELLDVSTNGQARDAGGSGGGDHQSVVRKS